MKRAIFLILLTSVISVRSSEIKSNEPFRDIINGLEKKSELGDADASGILGDLNCDGLLDTALSINNHYDRDKTKSLIKYSYDQSSPFGQYSYGAAITRGMFGFEKNEVEGKKIVTSAIDPLKNLAENNNSFACLALYYIYSSDQSKDGKNPEEAIAWLTRGLKLNNSACLYFLIREVLLDDNSDQKAVDAALYRLLELKRSYTHGIPKSKINELYALVIYKKFNNLKFDLVKTENLDKSVRSHFRNEKYHCDLILSFYPKKDGGLSVFPGITLFLNTEPGKNIHQNDTCFYTMTPPGLAALFDCREKFSEWVKKAHELYPPAFDKCLNADRKDKENGIIVNFEWNGIAQSRIRFGIGETVDQMTFLLLEEVFRNVSSTSKDPLSFYGRTLDCIESAKKAESKVKSQIEENFN